MGEAKIKYLRTNSDLESVAQPLKMISERRTRRFEGLTILSLFVFYIMQSQYTYKFSIHIIP